MKKKMLLSAVTLALVLAMSGCGGMKPEEAAARVQESLDAAKESAEKDQELQDLLLEGAGLDLQGQSAENHAEVLARVRSAIGLTASSAEKTEDGFAVTVDVVPVGIGITPFPGIKNVNADYSRAGGRIGIKRIENFCHVGSR